MSLVSFVRVPSNSYKDLKESIEKSLQLINFSFKNDIRKIVIKPNMCYYYHPSTGEVTDPYFVGALIDVLREKCGENSEIFVVESDASAMRCKYVFRFLGYDKLAEEKSFRLINLTEEKNRIIDAEVNDVKFKFYVPELFYDADLVINVPKPKYMDGVKITCALKNMFGCNAFQKKFIYHRSLNEAIVAINKLIRTDLVVLDGVIVHGKYTKRLNLVMSSSDPVAFDAAVAKIMGVNPMSVEQLVLASREGLGNLNFLPTGDFLYAKSEFPKKRLKDKARDTIAAIYLKIMQENK
ncbi:MAG: DUF362 domain-containing protein [Fervidobacterium sp.]